MCMKPSGTQHDSAVNVVFPHMFQLSLNLIGRYMTGSQTRLRFHTHQGELINHFIADTWFLAAEPLTGGSKHVDWVGFLFFLFARLAKGYRSPVSTSVLHCGGDPVQAVLPISGLRSCQRLRLSVRERKLPACSSGQQAVGRTLQAQERWWQRALAHQILQSDLQMYRWVVIFLVFFVGTLVYFHTCCF